MSTISSASTLAQVEAAYDDNASYAEDASVAKARAFVTACTILLRRLPEESQHGPARLRSRIQSIEQEKAAASQWLAANDTSRTARSFTHVSLETFR